MPHPSSSGQRLWDFVSIAQRSSVFQTLCRVGHLMFVCECGEEEHRYYLCLFLVLSHNYSSIICPVSLLASSTPLLKSDSLHSSNTDLKHPKHISTSGPLHLLFPLLQVSAQMSPPLRSPPWPPQLKQASHPLLFPVITTFFHHQSISCCLSISYLLNCWSLSLLPRGSPMGIGICLFFHHYIPNAEALATVDA